MHDQREFYASVVGRAVEDAIGTRRLTLELGEHEMNRWERCDCTRDATSRHVKVGQIGHCSKRRSLRNPSDGSME